jgi:dTDP-glucose 4,6-dehydratase
MPDPLCAANAYGVAKRQAEHLCALYADRYDIEPIVARCFAFVGEDLPLDVHFAIGNFIRDALFRDEIVINGDGCAVRSYMCQHELARWLMVLMQRGESCRAYNVGAEEAITLREVAHLVSELLGSGKSVRVLGKPDSGGSSRNQYVPDVGRAREELQLVNEVGLKEAIQRAGVAIRRRNEMR